MATNYKKKNFTYTYKDFHASYKKRKRANGTKVGDVIPYAKYRAAIEHFLMLVCRKIIREGFLFILPYGLGTILLKSARRTRDNAPVNWQLTRETGKIVRHLYMHTFGYYFFTKWAKSHVQFKNKTIYRFAFVDTRGAKEKDSGKRLIHEHIMKVANDPNLPSIHKY